MELPPGSARIDYENGFYVGEVTAEGGEIIENGYGMFSWNNGEIYVGNFRNGVRTGQGRMMFADGSVYEGDFLDDTRSGKGRMEWTDGTVYEGDFINGVRTGKGKVTWPSGQRYEGDFVDGKMDGMGIFYNADGSVDYDGEWIQSCPVNRK